MPNEEYASTHQYPETEPTTYTPADKAHLTMQALGLVGVPAALYGIGGMMAAGITTAETPLHRVLTQPEMLTSYGISAMLGTAALVGSFMAMRQRDRLEAEQYDQ